MSTINLDALVGPSLTRQPKPCVIARVLNELPDQYRAAVETLFADKSVTTAEIASRFHAAGLAGSHATLTRHRQGACCCERGGAR